MIRESYLNDPWIRLKRASTSSVAGTLMDPAHLKIRAGSGAITNAVPKSGSEAGSRAESKTALIYLFKEVNTVHFMLKQFTLKT